MTQGPVSTTPQALRDRVAEKLPHLLMQEQADLARMGEPLEPITADDVVYQLPFICFNIVMACPAFPFFEEECERLDHEGEPGTDTAAELARVREQWPHEIASCNLLVQEVVAAGCAQHLQGEALLDFIYEGMKPFTMGDSA
jgi:hypothetical protein